MFVDSHCHLDFPDFAGQLPQLLERMRAARVGGACEIPPGRAAQDADQDIAEQGG